MWRFSSGRLPYKEIRDPFWGVASMIRDKVPNKAGGNGAEKFEMSYIPLFLIAGCLARVHLL